MMRFLTSPVDERSLLTVHEPLGVAALIAPWNFPIGMPARKVRFLTSPVGEKSLLTVHEPLGLAALITPWNFPSGMPARKGEIF
jgi:acyl-CoA reductase-like NAD-dependent aldehyde dehydrogenase